MFKHLGPFTFAKTPVTSGDGRQWTAYILGFKMNRELRTAPDRFVIRYETKVKS